MKPTFIALLALCLCLGGCGKKEAKQTAKEPAPIKPGTVLWEFKTGKSTFGGVISSPAIGSEGTVYIGSWDKKLYAINGKSWVKLWEFETGGKVTSSPAIGSDGTVYVGSRDNKLYAIKTASKMASPKARGPCVDRMHGIRGVQSRPTPYSSLVSPNNPPCVRTW